MKITLFEFEDQDWFPQILREGMTDYLRFIFSVFNLYQPVIFLLDEMIEKTGAEKIIDLCSGSGGATEQILQNLETKCGRSIPAILTDKFPNIAAYKFLHKKNKDKIFYEKKSVDASDVPTDLKGLRTIFSGFHHFNEITAKKVLQNAVDAKESICIFDGGDKNIFIVLVIILLQPISFLLFTPFIKPFRFSRLFFTYLVPLIPLCTVWDGIISVMRLYKPQQLLKIAQSTTYTNYEWKSGKIKNRFGMSIAYLTGCFSSEIPH